MAAGDTDNELVVAVKFNSLFTKEMKIEMDIRYFTANPTYAEMILGQAEKFGSPLLKQLAKELRALRGVRKQPSDAVAEAPVSKGPVSNEEPVSKKYVGRLR